MSEVYSTDLFTVIKKQRANENRRKRMADPEYRKRDNAKHIALRKRRKSADPVVWREKEKARRESSPRKAMCHPDKPHQANGLCKPCYMKNFLASYKRPEDSVKKRRELSWRKRNISMTVAEYDARLKDQCGGCAICDKVKNDGRFLVVDHDHKTGKIRGLLCDYCNRRLLIPRNTAKILRRAAEYLEASA